MDADILKKLEEQEQKIDKIYRSVEKMRKYFLWSLIIGVVFIVLPLVGLIFIVPMFLKTLNLGDLGL